MRIQLHKMEMQIHKDKLVFLLKDCFDHVIAEAVFSKNCLLSIGEGTPYSALYGRVPRLLPQIEDVTGTARMHDDETGVAGSRSVQRLREIAVASAVESLAPRRLQLANKSKSAMAGEQFELKLGELAIKCWIDFTHDCQ